MSLKKTFSSDGKKCTVVFTVNPEAAAGATKIFLAGDFNSWDPTSIPMNKDPAGSFSVKKQVPWSLQGRQQSYSFPATPPHDYPQKSY